MYAKNQHPHPAGASVDFADLQAVSTWH